MGERHREEYSWHIMWRHRLPGSHYYLRWSHSKPPLIRYRCPQLNVASHLGCWGDQGQCVDLRRTKGGISGEPYWLKVMELLLISLCGARDTVLRLGHSLDIDSAALGDGILGLLGGEQVQDLASSEAWGPGEICQSVMHELQLIRGDRWPRHQGLLLGFGNITFWAAQNPGFCARHEELMAQWEFHTYRSVMRVLRPVFVEK